MNDKAHSIIENFSLEVSRIAQEAVHRLRNAQHEELAGEPVGPPPAQSSIPRQINVIQAVLKAQASIISYLRWRAIPPQSRSGPAASATPSIIDAVDNLCEAQYKRGLGAGLADRLSEIATSIKTWAQQRGGARRDIFDGPEEIHDGIRECFDKGVKCGWDSAMDSVVEYLYHWTNHEATPDRYGEPALHTIAQRRPSIHKAVRALVETCLRIGRKSHPRPDFGPGEMFSPGLSPASQPCSLRQSYLNKFDGMPPYRPESKPLETYIAFCEEQYNKLEAQCKQYEETTRGLRDANSSLSAVINKMNNAHVRDLLVSRQHGILEALKAYKTKLYSVQKTWNGEVPTTSTLDSMISDAKTVIDHLERDERETLGAEREEGQEGEE